MYDAKTYKMVAVGLAIACLNGLTLVIKLRGDEPHTQDKLIQTRVVFTPRYISLNIHVT